MPVSSVGAGDSAVPAVAFGVAVVSPVPVDDEVAGREVFVGAEVAGSAVDAPEVGPAGADVAAVAGPAESRVGTNVGVSSPPPQARAARATMARSAIVRNRGRRSRLKKVIAPNGQPVKDDVGSCDDHECRGDGLDVRQGPAHHAHHSALEYGHSEGHHHDYQAHAKSVEEEVAHHLQEGTGGAPNAHNSDKDG